VTHFRIGNTYIVVGVTYIWWCFVAIVEVGPKYRVTITQGVRRKTPLRVGQKVYLLARPPYIVLIPIPDDVDEALAEILGDIAYSREERKRAEEQLLKEAS
jgi:bifunctional DNA-binding transcriptional regulator/antitoxin component of YhaV-PrlF toxin-antitoxin module